MKNGVNEIFNEKFLKSINKIVAHLHDENLKLSNSEIVKLWDSSAAHQSTVGVI